MKNNRKAIYFLAIAFVVLITSCRGTSEGAEGFSALIGAGEELRSDSEFATDEAATEQAVKLTEETKPSTTATSGCGALDSTESSGRPARPCHRF